MEIKFGTDGWRGEIARDYTFENVAKAAHAVAEVMKKELPDRKEMIIGFDRRFLSQSFAQTVATVYAEHGYTVHLTDSYVPTPALSWCAKHQKNVAGATVITASHNPPHWNGFKYKEIFGGSARPILTQAFEKRAKDLRNISIPTQQQYETALRSEKIRLFSPLKTYFETLRTLVDIESIKKANFKIGLDVMHGAASVFYADFLRSIGVAVTELHGDDNPGFRGVAPEPIGKNLSELCALVSNNRLACGLATDGDADRLGAVDEEGKPFTTQQILSVVYWHMLKNRKMKWSIARSASTTRMVDLIATQNGLKCFETPVGFKFIAEKMVDGEAQIGGEESGGIGIINHIPERDGPLTGLLLLELMAQTGKGLKALYDQLCKDVRPYFFIRHDLHLSEKQATSAVERLEKNPPTEWDGRALDVLSRLDGYKFYMKDGSWLLIRKSGTEPIFRLYAEAESEAASQRLIDAAKKFVA